MGKAPSSSMYRWDHQPGAPRVRNPDFLDRPRIQVLVLGRNRQRFLTIKQSLELHGRHEVSAYTFNEDEAVELAQWKPTPRMSSKRHFNTWIVMATGRSISPSSSCIVSRFVRSSWQQCRQCRQGGDGILAHKP